MNHLPTIHFRWFQPIWKNISQNGNLPRIGLKIKNIWTHHPVFRFKVFFSYVFPLLPIANLQDQRRIQGIKGGITAVSPPTCLWAPRWLYQTAITSGKAEGNFFHSALKKTVWTARYDKSQGLGWVGDMSHEWYFWGERLPPHKKTSLRPSCCAEILIDPILILQWTCFEKKSARFPLSPSANETKYRGPFAKYPQDIHSYGNALEVGVWCGYS